MSSYNYRTTIVRLSYDIVRFTYDLASHQAIKVKSYVIVRPAFDCHTMSYDLPVISQTLPMRRKPIVSSVTTKLRLQYRSRVGENARNLRCHPSYGSPMSYDPRWSRTTTTHISHDHITISHIYKNRSKFLNMTKNTAKTSWDWPPMTATSCNVARFTPMVRDHPKTTHRRWS